MPTAHLEKSPLAPITRSAAAMKTAEGAENAVFSSIIGLWGHLCILDGISLHPKQQAGASLLTNVLKCLPSKQQQLTMRLFRVLMPTSLSPHRFTLAAPPRIKPRPRQGRKLKQSSTAPSAVLIKKHKSFIHCLTFAKLVQKASTKSKATMTESPFVCCTRADPAPDTHDEGEGRGEVQGLALELLLRDGVQVLHQSLQVGHLR